MLGALPHPSPHPSTPVTRRAFGAPVGEGSIQWPTREEQRGLRSPSPKCERAWGVETTRQGLAWLREPAAERADAGWPVTGRSLQRHTQWVARRPGGPQALLPVLAQPAVPCSLLPRNPARAMSRNETQPAPREAVSGEARGRCEVPSPPGRRGNSRGRCGSQEPAPRLRPLAERNVCRSSCPISVGLPRPVAPVPLSQASAAAQTRTRSRTAPPTCGARPASAFPCCEALCQMPHEHTRA